MSLEKWYFQISMDAKIFTQLFKEHREKLSEAWNKLSDQDLDGIHGDLGRFLQTVSTVYKVPDKVILKELDAIKKNIDTGNANADFAPHLDPRE